MCRLLNLRLPVMSVMRGDCRQKDADFSLFMLHSHYCFRYRSVVGYPRNWPARQSQMEPLKNRTLSKDWGNTHNITPYIRLYVTPSLAKRADLYQRFFFNNIPHFIPDSLSRCFFYTKLEKNLWMFPYRCHIPPRSYRLQKFCIRKTTAGLGRNIIIIIYRI